jgi:hypothetical protein
MTAFLVAHPPARSQFVAPRREEVSGVIAVHTAENAPDFVAFDGGAEAVARFIQHRTDPGSYHDLVDSDSIVDVVPYGYEAFHDGTGTNRHSLGLSIATRADVWPLAPQAWRAGAVENAARAAARMARYVHKRTGRVVPARRITAAQARARTPGFISHAELDPTRRTDPGAAFPWAQFLDRYADLTADLRGETDMPITTAEVAAIAEAVEARLLRRSEDNDTLAELVIDRTGLIVNTVNGRTGTIINATGAILNTVAGLDGVDEDRLAAALTPVLLERLDVEGAVTRALAAAGVTDVDEDAIAQAVAADLAARLGRPPA